jgi:hypothetical protein
MGRRGLDYDNIKSLKGHGHSLETIKDWRAREYEAGRPSGLKDFYDSHGLCFECRCTGEKIAGWDGKQYLLETCKACGGTGKSTP